MISATVLFTIVSALSVGIIAGYLAICGILKLMGSRTAPVSAAAPARVAQQAAASSSGD